MQTREIRVFISSTFNDMHPERDWLVKRTFPRLREMAAKRGVVLTEVDLRWGITEKESREGKTIAICLDEIINSQPFFIGILGNRYGWTPSVDELGAENLPERYDWVADDLSRNLSITEIEMQYGVLRNPRKIFASFYIREGGNDDDPHQTHLKNAVCEQDRYPVHSYSSPEQLGTQVEKQFMDLLDTIYPAESQDPALSARENHLTWAKIGSRYYLPDPRSIATIDSFLSAGRPGKMLVTGASGSGKSALLSYIAAREMESGDRYVIAHFPAAARQSNSSELAERLRHECSLAPGDARLTVIVDDAVAITDEYGNPDTSWIDAVPDNAVLIVSSADEHRITHSLKARTSEILTVLPLLLSQRRQLADNYFKSFSKHLDDSELEIIGRPSKVTDNTLAYVTLLEELRCFGSFDGLPEYIGIISGFDSAYDFYDFILRGKERFYTTERHPDMARSIFSLLSISAEGLTEHELAGISGIPPMYISQFILGNTFMIKRNGGVLRIAHSRIREAVEHRYLTDEEYADSMRRRIIAYFENDTADSIRRDIELPYQYRMTGNDRKLYLYITQIQYLRSCIEHNRLYFLRYWSYLFDISPALFPADGCLDSICIPDSDIPSESLMGTYYLSQTFVTINSDILLRFAYLMISHLRHYDTIGDMATRALLLLGKDQDNAHVRHLWMSLLGTVAGRTGNYDTALSLFARILKDTDSTDLEAAHTLLSNIAETYMTIAEATGNKIFNQRAADIQRMVLDYRIEKYGLLHPETAVAMDNLAGSLFSTGEVDEAGRLSEESARIYTQLNGEIDLDVAVSLLNQGDVAIRRKEYNEALRLGERIERILLELGGEDNVHLPDAYTLQTIAHAAMGHNEKVRGVLRKFIAFVNRNQRSVIDSGLFITMLVKASGTDNHDLVIEISDLYEQTGFDTPKNHAFCLNILGKSLLRSNLIEEGLDKYSKSIDIYISDGHTRDAVEATTGCASELSLKGFLTESAEWFEKGLNLMKDLDLEDDENTAYALQNYAVTLYNLKRSGDATRIMQRACDIRRTLFGDDDEMLQEQYIPLLDKFDEITDSMSLNDDSGYESYDNESVGIFKQLTTDSAAVTSFIRGMEFYRNGSMSHALQILSGIRQTLSGVNDADGAVAWVIRSIAYVNETINTEDSLELAVDQYGESLDMAMNTDNPYLIEKIAHDYAEFLWNQSQFDEAIRMYTYQMYGGFRQNGMTDITVMRCLGNMAAAMMQTDDPDAGFMINCGLMVMILANSNENNQYADWGESILMKSFEYAGISTDDYDLNPVESVYGMIDFFVGRRLYQGALVISHVYEGIPEDMFSVSDSFNYLLALSRIAEFYDPETALEKAYEAKEFADSHPDEISGPDLDRLYSHLGLMYMVYGMFPMASETFAKIVSPNNDTVENEMKCAFINSDSTLAAKLLDMIGDNTDAYAPESIELARIACSMDADIEILRDNLDADSPVDALYLILALQRSAAETEAHDLFAHLAGLSFSDTHMEMQRLYAIIRYLREANLDEEAEIYRKQAIFKAGSLSATDSRMFTTLFSDL